MEIVSEQLKILQYPHPSLRHPAKELTVIDKKVHLVAGRMLELMYEHAGLGLAAPQVGIPFRMFVVNYAGDPEKPDMAGVYLNPVILERKSSQEGEEGCLSFPKLFQKVRRAKTIKAVAYNLKGEEVQVELSNLPARLWQHEIDHLDGKLFIDYFGPIGNMASRGAIQEFERDYEKLRRKGEIPPSEEIEKQLTELERLA